jgi:glutaredoxin 3
MWGRDHQNALCGSWHARLSDLPAKAAPVGNATTKTDVEIDVKNVIVYSADWCPFCTRAKALLKSREIPFEEINVDRVPGFREKLVEMTGRMTVPQIMVDGEPIGGFDDIAALDRNGELLALVQD